MSDAAPSARTRHWQPNRRSKRSKLHPISLSRFCFHFVYSDLFFLLLSFFLFLFHSHSHRSLLSAAETKWRCWCEPQPLTLSYIGFWICFRWLLSECILNVNAEIFLSTKTTFFSLYPSITSFGTVFSKCFGGSLGLGDMDDGRIRVNTSSWSVCDLSLIADGQTIW